MGKIPDKFSGYLKIDNDVLSYFVSDSLVTMLPAEIGQKNLSDVFERVISRKVDTTEFIYGNYNGFIVAILRSDKFYYDLLRTNHSIIFTTPLIIMASGNTSGFYNDLTEDWNKFHAITFYGGNINPLFSPRIAIEPEKDFTSTNGARGIKFRPWDDYTLSKQLELFNEKVEITVSVMQDNEKIGFVGTDGYNLGQLNSFIRFTFENAQSFESIEKYYNVAKNLISLLTGESNTTFGVYISQKTSNDLFSKTADCKIVDRYENYSNKNETKVIPINCIFEYIPTLINLIANEETTQLLTLLSDNNKFRNRISITNVQDMCTALEIAYKWNREKRAKDELIDELKSSIKSAIADFTSKHPELDVSQQTTISSSFQYLDYTLKQKIYTLYSENQDIIDSIISKYSLPKINENSIAEFVKLRNAKTHKGKIEWGDCADMYIPLLALAYSTLLKHANFPDDIVKQAVLSLF